MRERDHSFDSKALKGAIDRTRDGFSEAGMVKLSDQQVKDRNSSIRKRKNKRSSKRHKGGRRELGEEEGASLLNRGEPGSPIRKKQTNGSEEEKNLIYYIEQYSFWIRLVVANSLYLTSLEKCNESYKKCFRKMHSRFLFWGIFIVISAFIFVNAGFGIFWDVFKSLKTQKDDKKREKPNYFILVIKIVILVLNYFWLCSREPGFSWKSHGTLSRIFFTMFIFKICGLKIVKYLYQLAAKKSRLYSNIALSILAIKVLGVVYYRIYSTQDEFYTGFEGSRIINCKECCKYRKIGINWYSAFDKIFWDFAHKRSSCSISDDDLSFLAKRFGKGYRQKVKYVAYPKSEVMSNRIRQHYHLFQQQFITNLEKVESIEAGSTSSAAYHTFLDITNPNAPRMRFKIQRDENLVQKMKDVMKKSNPKMHRPNVLVLMIDSISRQHFFRKLPKTRKFLESFYKNQKTEEISKNEQKDTSTKFSSYQFFRFHSLRQHHMANLLALRYDDREYWEAIHHWERFENNYKDEGYITATASAKCEVDEFDLEDNKKSKRYPDHRALDYEFFAAACDPNATPKQDPHSMFKGPFSEFRRCLYGQDASKHQLEFTKEFWRVYKDMPKVQMVTLMDGHEFTGEVVEYLDHHLVEFFKAMMEEGLLDDSIIFILSDHGNNSNLFFKGTASGMNELVSPFLAMMMSANNAKKYGEIVRKNEQALVSHHDVNRAINEIVRVYKEYAGQNFMTHEVDKGRTCGDAMIPPGFCRCLHPRGVDLNRLERKKHYGGGRV